MRSDSSLTVFPNDVSRPTRGHHRAYGRAPTRCPRAPDQEGRNPRVEARVRAGQGWEKLPKRVASGGGCNGGPHAPAEEPCRGDEQRYAGRAEHDLCAVHRPHDVTGAEPLGSPPCEPPDG